MNAKTKTKERPSERAMRLATQRAALDRILQAALREAVGVSPKDPTLTVHKAALWLQYALHRADTLTSSREERLPKRTPAEHLETMLECELDDPRDEIEARYGNLRDIAEELDPDFRRPIRGQADWTRPNPFASPSYAELLEALRSLLAFLEPDSQIDQNADPQLRAAAEAARAQAERLVARVLP